MKELTFAFDSKQELIEIHGNKEGLSHLISKIQDAMKQNDHQHLMTEDWGGNDLTNEKFNNSTSIINHVKIHYWEK